MCVSRGDVYNHSVRKALTLPTLEDPLEFDHRYSQYSLGHAVQQPSVSVMTDMTMESIGKLESECTTLQKENHKLCQSSRA